MAQTTVLLRTSGAGEWRVPGGVFSLDKVICIAGGSTGVTAGKGGAAGVGGNGGDYAEINNLAVVPGTIIAYHVAFSDLGLIPPISEVVTWFNGSEGLDATVYANIGGGISDFILPSRGDTVVRGVTFSGQVGGRAGNGDGSVSWTQTSDGVVARPGDQQSGTLGTGPAGNLYGGGGAGGAIGGFAGGSGAQGLIVIIYTTPIVPVPNSVIRRSRTLQ